MFNQAWISTNTGFQLSEGNLLHQLQEKNAGGYATSLWLPNFSFNTLFNLIEKLKKL